MSSELSVAQFLLDTFKRLLKSVERMKGTSYELGKDVCKVRLATRFAKVSGQVD